MNPRKGRSVASLLALAAAGIAVAAAPASPAATLREVHGARLHVDIRGHGPPLVFLAGGTLSVDANFREQRGAFAAGRTTIAIEQRSQGHSPDGPWSLSYAQMADDTAQLIQSLHLDPVDVVGDSDGANVALLLARDHPGLVRRIVASAANLRSGLTSEEVARRHAWTPAQLDEKLQQLSASFPPWIREDYARSSPDGPGHWLPVLAKFYFMWIEPVVIDAADLARIQAPVLVLVGDHDFTSVEEAQEMARALPHGQLFVVPGAGHGKMNERPRLVNLAMREFLDAPAAPPATPALSP